jgi:hypothetical protein
MATAISLIADFKSMHRWRVDKRRDLLLFDMCAQFALHDRFQERSHLVVRAIEMHFDTPIAQVPDPASNIESLRDMSDGIAKANALHITFEEDLHRPHA